MSFTNRGHLHNYFCNKYRHYDTKPQPPLSAVQVMTLYFFIMIIKMAAMRIAVFFKCRVVLLFLSYSLMYSQTTPFLSWGGSGNAHARRLLDCTFSKSNVNVPLGLVNVWKY